MVRLAKTVPSRLFILFFLRVVGVLLRLIKLLAHKIITHSSNGGFDFLELELELRTKVITIKLGNEHISVVVVPRLVINYLVVDFTLELFDPIVDIIRHQVDYTLSHSDIRDSSI